MADSKPLPRFLELWAETETEQLVPRVLISSNRHQMGKTATMVRIMEQVQEQLHGRKFDIADLCLETLEFMRRRKEVGEWHPIGLDEPQRPVGNKTWYTEESQAFVEDLVSTAYEHKPMLAALPHSHFLNNSIFGVATSLIVKTSRTHASVYGLDRDQLNRNFKTYTWKIGDFDIEPPYPWDWEAYQIKRDEFTTKRGKMLEAKVSTLNADSVDFTKEMVFDLAYANPDRFMDPRTRDVSASQIEAELGVPWSKAHYAATKVKRMRRERERAEAQA